MSPTGTSSLKDLRVHARTTPEKVAVVCDQQRWTYGELDSLANRTAQVLRASGLSRGDHVAMFMGNRPEILALVWAAWRSGVYLTPMPTSLTPTELAYMVEDCQAKMVICDARFAPNSATLKNQLGVSTVQWFSLGGAIDGYEALEDRLATASNEPITDECPGALMMYTSGTTGAPKGVIRPLLPPDWQGTPPCAADLLTLFDMGGSDVRYLSTQPLYHAAALRFALAVTAGGGFVHVMPRFDALEALDLLEQEKITHSQWVPAMFQRLLRVHESRRAAFTAPAHRCAIHGAAPCTPALKQAMIAWWGPILLEYYSGSEGVGLSLINSHEALTHPGSVGRIYKGQLHVVSDPHSDVELSAGEIGLLYFSGITPFEYHGAPDKTTTRTHAKGWQTMGDLGYADADGFLYLTDRMDDMIISGGVNVYPQEIERVILEVPGVEDCAVVGFPNDDFGERPVAFVVPQSPNSPASLLERVRTHCEIHLGRIKRPERLELIAQLPRTATGKLLRRQLRNQF
jgi:fatty-acyl-CoA synthase